MSLTTGQPPTPKPAVGNLNKSLNVFHLTQQSLKLCQLNRVHSLRHQPLRRMSWSSYTHNVAPFQPPTTDNRLPMSGSHVLLKCHLM